MPNIAPRNESQQLRTYVRLLALFSASIDGPPVELQREVLLSRFKRCAKEQIEHEALFAFARTAHEHAPDHEEAWRRPQIREIAKMLAKDTERERAFLFILRVVVAHRGVGRREEDFLAEIVDEFELEDRCVADCSAQVTREALTDALPPSRPRPICRASWYPFSS
jgi:hypothetical protein